MSLSKKIIIEIFHDGHNIVEYPDEECSWYIYKVEFNCQVEEKEKNIVVLTICSKLYEILYLKSSHISSLIVRVFAE